MGIFRSESMQHGTLVIPTERAVEIVTLLGHKGEVMIQDMNATSMKRPYRRYIQRIEEMERQLRYLMTEIQKLPGAKVMAGDVENFLQYDGFVLDGVEESLTTLTDQFAKFRANNDDLLSQRVRAVMERAVAKVAVKSLGNKDAESYVSGGQATQALLAGDPETGPTGSPGFSSFAGVVTQSDVDKLTRTVFRATRGNAFTYFEDMDEQLQEPRNVFVVYYPGGLGSAMHEKVTRICKAFGIDTFEWPKNSTHANQKIAELTEVISDKSKALEAFEEFFFDEVAVLLQPVYEKGNSLIEDWRLFCMQQKAIYGCLNLFEETEATLRADCWYPTASEENIRSLLRDFSGTHTVSAFLLSDKQGTMKKNPPTFTKTTAFTECFQNMVDTYGIPRYQEVNPALLSAVTFPFMFGVMYGDVGHGILVTLFGLLLIFNYETIKKMNDEVTSLIAYGRYMIFMMGCFAIYAGFLYNDFFALGFDIYGSRYKQKIISPDDPQHISDQAKHVQRYTPNLNVNFPYPFGIDPVWKDATNELDFLNSYKMKLSLIFAYVHMITGVIMKAFNAVYFRDWLTLLFEFFPQFIFMTSFVGYMDFLIILKWCQKYHGQNRQSIISVLIGIFMMKEIKPEDEYYSGQQKVERCLLLIMVICIPWMLLIKPILAKQMWKRKHNKSGEEKLLLGTDDDVVEEHFEFSEEFIHQMIETIEFVLGSISNTASYLRLWALSLAHQQLAVVFFEQILLMIIKNVVSPDGGVINIIVSAIAVFLGFGAFAAITFAIMLCMDTLECYLHTLRLHWVEFQNKFYKADGYKFVPFSFFRILSGLDNE